MKPVFSSWSEDDELEEREPFRTRIFRKGVGVIEMQYNDDETIMYCPYCKEYGFKVKLGPRILMDGEKTPPPDFENWLSCPDCYAVVAAYIVEGDASIIRDDIETVDNPFESNQSEIIGANARRTSRGGIKYRKRRNRPTHADNDIQRELDKHGSDNVHII